MTVADTLFTRILAMDSYFLGDDLPESLNWGSGSIGNAVFLGEGYLPTDAAAEGFYAAAYSINGVTVISYRGTDTRGELALTDLPIMDGQWQDDSVALAMAFYASVDAATNQPILLTGHSLGGALAGYVGSLMNRPGLLVDHIGFMDARARFLDVWSAYDAERDAGTLSTIFETAAQGWFGTADFQAAESKMSRH